MEDPTLILQMIDRYGVAAAVAVVLLIMIWKFGNRFFDKIAEPITAAHISLVKSVEATNITNTETSKQMVKILETKAETIDDIDKNVVIIKDKVVSLNPCQAKKE